MEGQLSEVRSLMRFRGYRGSRRNHGARPVVQSFKQVQWHAPVTLAAATKTDFQISAGLDNYAGPTASNLEVPTGALIKAIIIQASAVNVAAGASFIHFTLQNVLSGQSTLDPVSVGGNPNRNEVHKHLLRASGENQNINVDFVYKVPAKFQRVKEGAKWHIVMHATQPAVFAMNVIYKFYR